MASTALGLSVGSVASSVESAIAIAPSVMVIGLLACSLPPDLLYSPSLLSPLSLLVSPSLLSSPLLFPL